MNSKEFKRALEALGLEASDPGATALADAIVSTLDELARIEKELVKADLVVRSERGTLRANPLLEAALKHRRALAQLCNQLFPDGGAGSAAALLAMRRRR